MMRPLTPLESWFFLAGICIVFFCIGYGLDLIIGGLAHFMDRIFSIKED